MALPFAMHGLSARRLKLKDSPPTRLRIGTSTLVGESYRQHVLRRLRDDGAGETFTAIMIPSSVVTLGHCGTHITWGSG